MTTVMNSVPRRTLRRISTAPASTVEGRPLVANIRAMCVFQGGSNLSEDRYVNTFHFLSPQDYATDSPLIAQALDDFWSVTVINDPLGAFLSPYVSRDYEIRTYDMSDATPRVPAIFEHTLPPVHTGGALGSVPEEVAHCLSYHTIPPITARRRGRIYIGPLCSAAVSNATTSNPTRVNSSLRNAANGAAVNLVDEGLGWAVYSPTADTYGVIVAGWSDDAFDTQRRRGAGATSKTLWNS